MRRSIFLILIRYKKYVSKKSFLIFFAAFNFSAKAQESISLTFEPDQVSIDRYNNLYLSDRSGNIYKYDSTGHLLNTFSPKRRGRVGLLEAWNTVTVAAFYPELQDYILLDRFLSRTPDIKIDAKNVGFIRLAAPSTDGNMWLIDDSDFSIKKVNIASGDIMLKTPLDLLLEAGAYDLSFIREYNNMLFVNDRNSGILVFDNMGNYKKKLPFKNVEQFGFYKEILYFRKDSVILHFFNLYDFSEKDVELPHPADQVVLFGKGRVTLVNQKKISFISLDNLP